MGGSRESETTWLLCIQEEFQEVKKEKKKNGETLFRGDGQTFS